MNILILAAGEGRRFAEDGFKVPKPYIPLGDRKIYQHVIKNYRIPKRLIHMVRQTAHRSFKVQDVKSIWVTDPTWGPAETLQLALKSTKLSFGPLVVLDSDCWLKLDIVEHLTQWMNVDRYAVRDALVFSVPHNTEGRNHFTVPVPMVKPNESNYSKRFVPALARFETATDRINPGLYVFQNVDIALNMANKYMGTRPHGEATMPKMMEYHWNRYMIGVVELGVPFTSVGTPQEYKDYLCTL